MLPGILTRHASTSAMHRDLSLKNKNKNKNKNKKTKTKLELSFKNS
jgi:hypothetical protein